MRLFALLLWVSLSGATLIPHDPRPGTCEDLSCATKEELLEVIRGLHDEKVALGLIHMGVFKGTQADSSPNTFFAAPAADPAPTAPTCNICASNPCLNGGTCHADPSNPWGRYYCECPDTFGGSYCEKNITCTAKSCGQNAVCYVQNHQTNCVCQLGYTGSDPQKQGCKAKIVKACADGDPHYTTFDGLYFDYQGTCPYIFSQPCTGLLHGFQNYTVVAKNELVNGAHVSYVSEIEVTMYNQKVHIDRTTRNVYMNGYRVNVPYYYPTKSLPQVSVTYSGGTFYVANDQLVTVTFTTGGQLCLQIPDVPDFQGNRTLCGLAGNYDKNYKNDVVYANGTFYTIDSGHMPTSKSLNSFNHAEDTWITDDFLQLRAGQDKCITGEILGNNTNCDPQPAVVACDPIKQSASGAGVFGACQPLGNETIQNFFDNCVFDVCHGTQKCDVISNYAKFCQSQLPQISLPSDWRTSPTVGCPVTCPPYSIYSTCVSSCPSTCADQSAPDFCDQPCTDGCGCQPGYVLDTTQLTQVTCVPVQSCGCTDLNGNLHPADTPWLSNNCQIWSTCRNGSYTSKPNQCDDWAYCGIDASGNMACLCDQGFRGDGYNCTDINECVENPDSCSQDKGQGICINTPGSYNCTCAEFYTGRDCQYYRPRRHCADLFKYWGITTTGVNTINPPYSVNGMPAFSDISVFCDMDLQGGGWTYMSHDSGNGFSNRSYNNYVTGFGDPNSQNLWLGLNLINQMTNEMPTSLILKLFRCARNGMNALTTYCTYPDFSVGEKNTSYAVTVPQGCSGTEQTYYDGWARWNLKEQGPAFTNFDSNDSGCSTTYQNTGFWYDETFSRCGAADLNGVRYSCDHQPEDSSSYNYLFWNGSPIGDAWLMLRPKNFPNYDPHPVN